MREIKKIHPDVHFEGIFGPKMEKISNNCWARSNELSVMGIIEPIKRLPHLILLRKRILKKWLKYPPDIFIGIDAPDFNFGVEQRLKSNNIPTFHYVAPTVWAWRKGRVFEIKKKC